MEANETAVPGSDDVQMDEQGRLVPAYALYNVKGVAWATFFGSLLGGSVVMAINYGRLGKQDARRQALIGGALGTILIFGIALLLPEDVPRLLTSAFHLSQIGLMYGIASSRQGPAIRLHRLEGGPLASVWRAVGIGCLCAIGLFGPLFGIAYAIDTYELGTRIEFNANDEVYYSGEATEEDAQRLGEVLTGYEFFGDPSGVSVHIKASAGRAWNEATTVQYYEDLGHALADSGFGRPLTTHLCDEYLDRQKSLHIESHRYGETEI